MTDQLKATSRRKSIADIEYHISQLGATPDKATLTVLLETKQLLESGNLPGFYADLYYYYQNLGYMRLQSAALGGFYAVQIAKVVDPLIAIQSGSVKPVISNVGLSGVPSWIVMGLLDGIHNYLSRSGAKMTDCFHIGDRSRGSAELIRPLEDLLTFKGFLAAADEEIDSGRRPSTSVGIAKLEQTVANAFKEYKSAGYSKRSLEKVLPRIRRVLSAMRAEAGIGDG